MRKATGYSTLETSANDTRQQPGEMGRGSTFKSNGLTIENDYVLSRASSPVKAPPGTSLGPERAGSAFK